MRAAPLKVRSVIDAVEASLREQILDQEIPMGALVKETDVARAFNVARPTAKAAIERLVYAGLLRRDANKSSRVPTLTPEDVNDLYVARSLLESQVARELAQRGQFPPSAADSIAELRRLGTEAAPARYVAPDIAFHQALTDQLGNQRIMRFHHGLMQEMHLCMAQVQYLRLLSPALIAAEHEEIGAAIEERDPDTAALAVTNHLERARKALTDHLSAHRAEPPPPAGAATASSGRSD